MIISIIILGIIQGIAEFLPISSSAHLIIFRDIFHIGSSMDNEVALAFDIALHLGTLLAIILYFFKDFWNMFIKGITKGTKDSEGKILWYLVVATIPAAICGLLFEETIETVVRSNYILIAIALAVMGIIIYQIDKRSKQENSIKEMTMSQAFFIGCAQVFALIPGFSRSGTTIAAARALKLNREDSAKFSFFLSAPVVLGAAVLSLLKKETWIIINTNLTIFAIGMLVAFISGLICIEFLLKYLRKHDFKVFMWYRVILALIVLALVIF